MHEGVSDVTEIRLRAAQGRDIEAIVGMNHALFQEDSGTRDPFTNQERARQEGADYFSSHVTSDRSLVLVAESGGEPVGYLIGYLRHPQSVRPVTIAELESMFVAQGERSRGVGLQLIDAFVPWSQNRDVARMSVTAFASNDAAIRFYERCGFEPHTVALERSL
jgi:GNAT superfamily N-acetyltransferase